METAPPTCPPTAGEAGSRPIRPPLLPRPPQPTRRARPSCRRLPDVDPQSAGPDEAIGGSPAVARQRWRLVLARGAGAPAIAGRELTDAWEQALAETALPLYRPAGRSRARFSLGAPLPIGMAAERELADVVLTEVVPIWRVREALSGR